MKMKRFLSGALACVLSVGLLWMAPSMEAFASGGIPVTINGEDAGEATATLDNYTVIADASWITITGMHVAIHLRLDNNADPAENPIVATFSGSDFISGSVAFFATSSASAILETEFDLGGSDGESHHHPKTDSSSDYSYHEVDGELIYGGLVDGKLAGSTMVPASAYPVFNDFAIKKLQKGETNEDGKLVIKCNVWKSLPEKVMKAMQETSKDVELIYTASDNQTYVIEVPSGLDVMQYVDENGYCGLEYLGSKLGQSLYVK